MSDYINREDALKAVDDIVCDADDAERACDRIIDLPSADVAPVRHGHWEVIDAEEPRRYGCSKCKRLSWNMENYCPNCGARMDGERKNDDKSCDTCKHYDKGWDDIICDGCTKAHSNWERKDDE